MTTPTASAVAIVATARHLRCPLITADEIIQDGDWVDTVWE